MKITIQAVHLDDKEVVLSGVAIEVDAHPSHGALLAGQREIIRLLTALPQEIQTMLDKETLDLITAFDTATTAVASRIERLVSQLSDRPTPEDVATLKTALRSEVSRLTILGQDPETPVPQE